MADFRYGFFCRPDSKKVESRPEEKSKTSHVPDHKSEPARVDAEGRRQPIAVLPRTKYNITTTETYSEEVYSSLRGESQHSHTKKYEPVKKYYGVHHEFNKLIPKVPMEARQPKHEMSLSGPMTDIEKAIDYLKEAVNHPKKESYTKTIDSKEAARRYGNLGRPPPVHGANVATIDCKEAARKYKGATV